MKVSIITPCYNAATFIEATIHSIQQQTLRDWELLVVDDGSVDNSADIVRRMAKDDNRIKLIQKENGGTASARKLGLELAQGEYIQFLDADDQIDINKLFCQTTEMDASNLDVTYTDWCYITPSGEKEDIKGMNSSLTRILTFWGIFGTLPIHCFLYRRDFLEKHHITFTTAIKEREDWDFHIQIYSARPKIKRIKGYCGAVYMKSPTGKTTCGDLGKQRAGTLRFLAFEIKQQRGYKRLLLSLRLSVELCFLFLSTIKYRIWEQLQLLTIFKQSWFTRIEVILALLLSPVALGIIIVYLFYTRCFAK
jgi:glycosyltransferase involved in cell wall biosynthesis